MNAPNRHAALMRQYTEEHILDPFAYRNWEFQCVGVCLPDHWQACNGGPSWKADLDYRRKAKTISIGGIEVPEPMRVAPEHGTYYYVAVPRSPDLYRCTRWWGGSFDWAALKHNMCHKTKEAAVAHAKALIIASGGAVGE